MNEAEQFLEQLRGLFDAFAQMDEPFQRDLIKALRERNATNETARLMKQLSEKQWRP